MARPGRRGSQQAEEEDRSQSVVQGLVSTEIAGVREEIRSEMSALLEQLEKKMLDQLKSATDQLSAQPNKAVIKDLVAEACREESASLAEQGPSGSQTAAGNKGSRGIFPTVEIAKKEQQRLIAYVDSYINNHMWNNGTRIVDKNDKCFPELVRTAMTVALQITDRDFMDQMAGYFGPLLCNRVNKKLDNAKSKYRSDLTKKRR